MEIFAILITLVRKKINGYNFDLEKKKKKDNNTSLIYNLNFIR